MRNLNKLFHIGELNLEKISLPNRRAGFSYEGNGLSVSQDPEAWKKIARLGGRKMYILEKDNPKFMDAYDDNQREAALNWCLQEDLIQKGTIYKVWMSDEEGGHAI